MNFWWILYTIDGVLFAVVAFTVLYFIVFSVASLLKHRNEPKRAKEQHRYIVMVASHKQGQAVLNTVQSVLGQTYPQRLFDVVVISDNETDLTNMKLAQLPITLLTPNFEKGSKAKALQYATFNLPKFKIYDAIIVLDAGNIVKPDFIQEVNAAYSSSGTKAIQVHLLAANRDTPIARLDNIFEEINNSVFRRGHQAMGLTAALCSSGNVFDFQWFKTNIMKVDSTDDIEKPLDGLLMRDVIYVDYFDHIFVFNEKTRTVEEFNNRRGHWFYAQIHSLVSNIRFLPGAILNRRYDQADKIIQWMLIPRTVLITIIAAMSVILPFIYWSLVIKWWIIGALILLAFAVATPDYLVDKNWDRDFLLAPLIALGGVANIFTASKNEATDRVLGITNWLKKLKVKKKKRKKY